MISIVIKDRTWTNYVKTIYRDRGDGASGFTGLSITTSEPGGYESIKFQIPYFAPFESTLFNVYYSVDVWECRRKIWQGRIKRPLQYNADGYVEIEGEGIGPAWGKGQVWEVTAASNTPHGWFAAAFLANKNINLLSADASQITTTGNSYVITNRVWQGATSEQVFNEVANFGFDDYSAGAWGVDSGGKENWISDAGNRFYWRKIDMSVVDFVLPFSWLDECSIISDMDQYANTVDAEYSGGWTSVTNATSKNLYTPGAAQWATINVNTSTSTATVADATQAANVYLSQHDTPQPKGEILLGDKFLQYCGGLMSIFDLRAGKNVRIPGLTMAHPDLIGTVTDDTVYRIIRSEYDDEEYTMRLTLNDYLDNSAVMIARLNK